VIKMKTYLECIPCFFKQALFAAGAATDDLAKRKQVMDRIAELVPGIPLNDPPPETARAIYAAIREVTGVADPFATHKEDSIRLALQLYGEMKTVVTDAEDPLRMAARIAIAGNVIDFGANRHFDLEEEMKYISGKALYIDHYASFRHSIEQARTILILGDNAGETVFDRILIETIGKPAIYAVRAAPIINDATIEDARKSGIDQVADIISSGCDAPGTILSRCSSTFLDIFRSADVIVSKGQGNYESLSEEKRPIFFLLKVKCPVAARHLDAPEGELILKDNRL
jgi:damage-control phosphatase, subfamily I